MHEIQLKSPCNDFINNLSSVLSVYIIVWNLVVFPYILEFKVSTLAHWEGSWITWVDDCTAAHTLCKTTAVKPSFIVRVCYALLISDVFGVCLTRQLQEVHKILSENFFAVWHVKWE